MFSGSTRVIGRKFCIKCGYPIQVEAYTVDSAFSLLKGYKECHNYAKGDTTGFCGSSSFTPDAIEIVHRRKR
jgi:hypothetical protein